MKRPAQPLKCERHGAVAGWECTVCHHPLCPDCCALKVLSPITIPACGRCGEMAEPLLRRKGEAASLAQRIPGAFLFPFKGEGLPAWLGISMFLWVLSLLGGMGFVIGWGIALASLFGLTRSTARGGEHLELSDFQDPVQSIFTPLLRFGFVMFPAWGGAILALRYQKPWLTWAALLVTALWSPTAYIGAAAGTSLLNLMNPVRVLGATARIGKDFGVYLLGIFAVGATILVSFPVAFLVNRTLLVPVLSGVLTQMVLSFGPVVGARLAGLVLMLHGPVFGWGDERELWEPVLGATQPKGELPVKRSLPAHLPMSIELEPEAPSLQPAQQVDRFAALEVNPNAEAPPDVAPLDVALLPSFGEQSALTIRRAIAAGKGDAALDGFRSTGLTSAQSLTFDELVWLGQTASSLIDYESAELAFVKASARPAPAEELGRARVMLARLLAERLNRKDDATKWMERVVAEHPGTKAADYAQTWLAGK